MRRKWTNDPDFRNAISDKNSGKSAWNKGLSMSDTMKANLSAARKGRRHSAATKRKIRDAAQARSRAALAAATNQDADADADADRDRPARNRHRNDQGGDQPPVSLISEANRAAVSARMSGVPKSEEHKAKIGMAMRKRHAAKRMLQAVEAYYSQQGDEDKEVEVEEELEMEETGREVEEGEKKRKEIAMGETVAKNDVTTTKKSTTDHPSTSSSSSSSTTTTSEASSPRPPASTSPSTNPITPTGTPATPTTTTTTTTTTTPRPQSTPRMPLMTSVSNAKRGKLASKGQIMDEYMAMLREYRALKEELTPWTTAFAGQFGRKPRLADVERTGIAWLVSKYKQYNVLRERILGDTSRLRDRVAGAREDTRSVVARLSKNKNARGASVTTGEGMTTTVQNINYVPGMSATHQSVAARWMNIQQYKKKGTKTSTTTTSTTTTKGAASNGSGATGVGSASSPSSSSSSSSSSSAVAISGVSLPGVTSGENGAAAFDIIAEVDTSPFFPAAHSDYSDAEDVEEDLEGDNLRTRRRTTDASTSEECNPPPPPHPDPTASSDVDAATAALAAATAAAREADAAAAAAAAETDGELEVDVGDVRDPRGRAALAAALQYRSNKAASTAAGARAAMREGELNLHRHSTTTRSGYPNLEQKGAEVGASTVRNQERASVTTAAKAVVSARFVSTTDKEKKKKKKKTEEHEETGEGDVLGREERG